MGFYRLIYRIGKMIFRDFLFKIPKKYLIIIIIFLVFMLLKSSVFGAFSPSDVPQRDLTDVIVKLPYENIVAWYEYYPLYNGTGTYTLDTNYRIFTNENNKIIFDGTMYTDAIQADTVGHGVFGFRSSYTNGAWSTINWKTYSFDIFENGRQFLAFKGSVNNTAKYNITSTFAQTYTFYYSVIATNNGNFEINYKRGANGTVNNTNITFTDNNNNYTSYINDMGYLSFNVGSVSNALEKIHNVYINNSNNEMVHDLYPVKADISGTYLYGLYDIYGGDFYSLNGVTLNIADFGNQLSGNDIPSNMNNFNIPPSITNLDSSIESWTFDNLYIDGGSLENITNDVQNDFYLIQYYDGKRIKLNINDYKTVTMNHVSFSVPRSVLLANSAIINGYTVDFRLSVIPQLFGSETEYVMSDYTLNITQTAQDNINEDKTQQSLSDITNAQQETTNAINNMNSSINNMNNTITNDNLSSSVIQQPTVPTDSSGVENGVNNIFTVIMNAFTNFDSSQDVVLPIPFTDKNITISGDYIRDMLTSVNASWVINFITIFWWYIISVYIVKDVLKTVDKIQEGKIDSVESSNIKGDML